MPEKYSPSSVIKNIKAKAGITDEDDIKAAEQVDKAIQNEAEITGESTIRNRNTVKVIN